MQIGPPVTILTTGPGIGLTAKKVLESLYQDDNSDRRLAEMVKATEEKVKAKANGPASAEITVLDPSGAHEITHLFAGRLDTLDDKVIAELAVDPFKWQPHRTFAAMEEEIKKKYPTAKFISHTEFPQGIQINDDAVAAMVKEKGADACIIGNAA